MLQISFKPGDRLVLYTDGVTESTNRDGQELGVGGLEKYFKESARLPPRECLQAMSDRVHEFRSGVPAGDDQLLLEIAYHSATADTVDPPLEGERSQSVQSSRRRHLRETEPD